MTNEINRMTKGEARKILEEGGGLGFESWDWRDFTYQCGCNEDGYECCYESFNTVEDMLEHLESMCDGKWEEVEEL